MAMNGNTLGDAIYAAVKAHLAWSPAGADDAKAQQFWRIVGQQIVSHITSNAQVAVVSVSGVQTGGGVSGPGTGTVT